MELRFTKDSYKAVQKAGAKSPVFHEEDPWREVEVETRLIMAEDYALIKTTLMKDKLFQFIENRRIVRGIENLEKIQAGDGKAVKIKTLPLLAEAARDVIGKTKNKFAFFKNDKFGCLLPYFVEAVRYHPPERFSDAHVNVELRALHRGDKEKDNTHAQRTARFYRADLGGHTVAQILEKKGLLVETENLMEEYLEDLKRHEDIAPRTGEQYVARGQAEHLSSDDDDENNRYRHEILQMLRQGEGARVVIDDQIDFGDQTAHLSTTFWTKGKGDEDDGDEEGAKDYVIPIHPVVRVFDLWRHAFVVIHVTNLEKYIYDAKIIDKIVLPTDHKRLIEALVTGTVKRMDDVVKGKAAGIIVLCTGMPGTGKTLTAEVYGEVAKRPLYTVQCSQLGTDSDDLEKNLSEALERANRWRAILLIDEADVYIYERGHNLYQNAIVGVFLRLLEYFNGILFMNTNREDVIDDAILSRATAHLRYHNPDPEKAARIWRILLKQYSVDGSDAFVEKVLAKWPGISGRNIRQIVRLGKMMADQEKRDATLEDLAFAADFQDLAWKQPQ